MLRIGLLWHALDSGNLGVRALTLAQLQILDRAAAAAGRRAEAVLFGHPPWTGGAASSFAGSAIAIADAVPLTAADLIRRGRGILAAFRRCDLLLDISEGDSFTDVYGLRRYGKQVATKGMALASGRPLALAPQTIGPFRRGRRAAPAAILRRAAAVFARDGRSAAAARELGCGNAVETVDVAFVLPFTRPARGGGPVRIGLNVSGLLYDASPGRFGLKASYRALVDVLIEELMARQECELHLVTHVLRTPGSLDQDVAVSERLAARHAKLRLAEPFADPRLAKSFIAGLDFFIGARMHACIAAFSAGVPLMPLAYTRKATGLFDSLGYPVGDLRSEGTQQLAAATLAALADRESLRVRLEEGNAQAGERLGAYTGWIGDMVRRL